MERVVHPGRAPWAPTGRTRRARSTRARATRTAPRRSRRRSPARRCPRPRRRGGRRPWRGPPPETVQVSDLLQGRQQPRRRWVEDNVVQEIDVETGAVLFEWPEFGSIAGSASPYRSAPTDPAPDARPLPPQLVPLDADGNLLISARHDGRDLRDRPRDPRVVWRLGGGELLRMDPGTDFPPPARRPPPGDGTIRCSTTSRRGPLPRRALARRSPCARPGGRHGAVARGRSTPTALLSPRRGRSVQGGGEFVGWGGCPPSSRVRHHAAVLDAGFAPAGVESYRAFRFPWAATAPGRRGGRCAAKVYASWNGATGVAASRAPRRRGRGRPAQRLRDPPRGSRGRGRRPRARPWTRTAGCRGRRRLKPADARRN